MQDRLNEIRDRLDKATPAPWILGGCSGRMITTPDGYVGDGFIADVDTKLNAALIANSPADIQFLLDALQEAQKENGWYQTAYFAQRDERIKLQVELQKLQDREQSFKNQVNHYKDLAKLNISSFFESRDRELVLQAEVAKLKETYTDEQGTVWETPTAWAYASACNALHKHHKQERVLREALEEIVNPIKYLQDKIDDDGCMLDGGYTVKLSNDSNYLKQIAREALNQEGRHEKAKETPD